MATTSNRHVNIADLVPAVQARVTTLCTSVASVSRSQTTTYKNLVDLVLSVELLPAAVVVLGPIDYDDALGAPAQRHRTPNLGVLLVGEYDADPDAGGMELWALLDEVDRAFMPSAARGDDERAPVVVLGDQTGSGRGVMLLPAGWTPVEAGEPRCAGVYNLLAIDDVRERSDD